MLFVAKVNLLIILNIKIKICYENDVTNQIINYEINKTYLKTNK